MPMDRFEAMQLFVSVAELQSFAAAARRHGLSPARVTRAVAALEAKLGARLLHRTTRAVRLTEAGATYLVHCKRILGDVEVAESLAATSHRDLSGVVSITAPLLFGRLHVSSIVNAFLKQHAQLSMRVLFADHVLDFFDRNIDVAIRIAHLPDSGLRAVQVGHVRRVVCASPSYLRARGTPRHPRELSEHETIGFVDDAALQVWSFAIEGRHERITPRPRLVVNTADLAISAARAGHGLARLLSYQVKEDVEQKRLRIVLAEYEREPVPVHVVRVEGREASARVRAFAEFAASQLKAALA
jgi:DNA-binding transcriptional LysR family regulator